MKDELYNKILDILEDSRKLGSIDKYEAARKIADHIHNINVKAEKAKRAKISPYDWTDR